MASTVARSSTSTLADQVFKTLQAAIIEGALKPGEKLKEPELSARYGVSRGPLRDAIRRLEARKLVVSAPNSGARVVSLTRQQLLELYEMREALEGMICRLAASAISDEELASLGQLLDQHEAAIEDSAGRDYFRQEGDLDFHFRLARASGNTLLADILCQDHYPLLRMYRYQFSASPGRPERALYEHRRILEALAERDGDLAEMLMRKHIRNARRNAAERTKDEAPIGAMKG
ncbi:MAG: GntR family transcriptional regulator [Pseudomonadota bacterium]